MQQNKVVGIACATLVGIGLVVWGIKRRNLQKRRTPKGVVSELWTYPVKSCKGITVPEVALDAFGVVHDRALMLVDTNGMFISQRIKPKMAVISATRNGNELILSSPLHNGADLVVQIPTDATTTQTITVDIWDDKVEALIVAGAEEWLKGALGTDARLVTIQPESSHSRPVDPKRNPYGKAQHVAFQDGFPQLVITDTAVPHLNELLAAKGVTQMADIRRFRPNIVVKGFNAHEEDEWKTIKIGNVIYDAVKPCARCSIPTVDQDTGKYQSGFEPIKTLRSYRTVGEEVMFGMNLIHRSEGVVRVGDTVEVLEWQ